MGATRAVVCLCLAACLRASALPNKGAEVANARVQLEGARGGTAKVIDGEYTETSEKINEYPTYKNHDGSRWLVRSKGQDGASPARWYVQDTASKGLDGGWAYTEAAAPNPKSTWRVWTGAEWESQRLEKTGYLLPSKKVVDKKALKKAATKTAAGEVAAIIKKGNLSVPKAIKTAESDNALAAVETAESDASKVVKTAAKTESTSAATAAKQVEAADAKDALHAEHTFAEKAMTNGLEKAGYHKDDVSKILKVFASAIKTTKLRLGESEGEACTPARAAHVLRDHIVETSAAITKITGKPVPPAHAAVKTSNPALGPVKNSFKREKQAPEKAQTNSKKADQPKGKGAAVTAPKQQETQKSATTGAKPIAPTAKTKATMPNNKHIETRLGEARHFRLTATDRAKVEAAAAWEPKTKGPGLKLSAKDQAKVEAAVQKELAQSQTFLANLDNAAQLPTLP